MIDPTLSSGIVTCPKVSFEMVMFSFVRETTSPVSTSPVESVTRTRSMS